MIFSAAGAAETCAGLPFLAPIWVASSTIAAVLSNTGTISIAYPAGIQAGDTMLVQMGVRNYAGSDPPTRSGWFADFGPQTQGNASQTLYGTGAAATGSESGTIAFTWSTGASHNMVCGIMHIFRYCAQNDMIHNGQAGVILDTTGSSSSGAAAGLSFTTTVENILLAVFGATNSGGAVGTPSGWTSRDSQTTAVGSDFGLNLVTKAMAAPGSISGGSYADQGGDATVVRGFGIHGRYG